MKRKDVEIGARYTCKVSGRVQIVRVVGIRERSVVFSDRTTHVIQAVNVATGRRIVIRSPQRLRTKVTTAGNAVSDLGCEFCARAFNRPEDVGRWSCPYCGRVWGTRDSDDAARAVEG